MDGLNAVEKRYLDTYLRINITPEVDKITSKCMSVDLIIKKREVRFSEECMHLLWTHLHTLAQMYMLFHRRSLDPF